ncbi:hypothetical protein, partial [Bradyrhizobium elkanii]|uniref:hypothetical protein n=1 Tax=Bradyrhizobium elkanii TaxID=29448 RepID=UPI001AEBBAF5
GPCFRRDDDGDESQFKVTNTRCHHPRMRVIQYTREEHLSWVQAEYFLIAGLTGFADLPVGVICRRWRKGI